MQMMFLKMFTYVNKSDSYQTVDKQLKCENSQF